jgi:predicted phage terminase large subunit-like protein
MLRKPAREIMVAGYNDALASTCGRSTRDIVTDKRASKPFPSFELNRETRAVDFWKTMQKGAYYAVGMGGTTTGRGANILMVDDPYKTREEAESKTIRQKIWSFYTASLITRLQPDVDGQPAIQIVTHTRWHPDDIGGRILESEEFKNGEWIHLNFAALREKDTSVYISRSDLPQDDPRYIPQTSEVNGKKRKLMHKHVKPSDRLVLQKPKQVALWPERFPVEYLLKTKKAIGDREFEALFQQNPYIIGGNIMKESWFRRYGPEELPTNFHAVVIAADTAFKAKTQNDYSVAIVGGVTDTGDIYVLSVYRDKLDFPALKKKVIGINATWRGKGLRGWWVEDKASGQSLIQELKANSGVIMLPWKPGSDDKVNRLNSITPLVEGGRVYLPKDALWLEEFLAELVAFPAVKNDDQVDAFVILMDVLSRMVIVGQQDFNAPIGAFVADRRLTGDLLFGDAPLKADPKGWAGGGFAEAAKEFQWKGWGQ